MSRACVRLPAARTRDLAAIVFWLRPSLRFYRSCESTYKLASSVIALDMAVTIDSMAAGGGGAEVGITEETPLATPLEPSSEVAVVEGFDPDLYRQPVLKTRGGAR